MAEVLHRIPGRPEVRYSAFVLVALATLALTAWSAAVLAPGEPMFGLELVGRGYVYFQPDQPARGAGLQRGDRVIGIDGQRLRERFRTAGDARAGETLSVAYVREGVARETHLELAALEGPERTLTFERLILAILFWLSSTGVWLFRPGELAARRFFVFSHVMTAYLSAETLDLLYAPAFVASDLLRLVVVPTLAAFLVLFPTPLDAPWSRRLPAAAYGLAGILLALYAAHLLSPNEFLSSLTFWRGALFVDVTILITALVLLLLPWRIRSLTALHRRRAILFGMIVGMLPTLFLTMMARALLGEPILEYVWTIPFVAFIPTSLAAALYTGELGKVDWFINRSLVYVLLTVVLLAVYGAAFFVLSRYLSASRAWTFALSGTIVALTAGALFQPVQIRLQQWVDRLFYGGWYDYRTFIESATSDLSRVGDQETLLDRLRSACAAMRRLEFGILMRCQDRFDVVREVGLSELQERTSIHADGLLAEHLRRLAAPVSSRKLRVPEISRGCSPEDAGALVAFDAHRWIPMISKDVLRGIIIVRDDDEHELPREDLAILATISRQAAVACENLALLDSLRERLEQVQHMNDELQETRFRLAAGREQERLHLARELHDGPVQDLYAVMHRLESLESSDAPDSREASRRFREDLAGVAATLRQICSELRPPLLTDFGLQAALRELVIEFQEGHPGLRTSLQVVTGEREFREPVRSALYRISQEALRNVGQHANASSVAVRLEADAEQTVLRIRDDGRGFVVPRKLIEMGRQGHLGLLGIGERAEAIGGRLTVESRPGHGTSIRVVVPASPNADGEPSPDSEIAP